MTAQQITINKGAGQMAISGAFIFPHPPIIIPEVGRGEEAKISATIDAYRECAKRIAKLKPDTILFISPHSTIYSDYFHISPGASARGDFGDFRAGKVIREVTYDEELTAAITEEAENELLPAGTLGSAGTSLDHGTLIPLYFIQEEYTDFKAVRMGFSGLPAITHYCMGQCIEKAAEKLGRNLVIVASGDLSHKLKEEGPYGFNKNGPVFDTIVTGIMADGDFLKFLTMSDAVSGPAAECGLRSFQIMSGALDRLAVMPELLSHEGPFGVGYAVASFIVTGRDESRNFGEQYLAAEDEKTRNIREEESAVVKLARYTVERYVKTGEMPPRPEKIPAELLSRRAGTFVSLHEFDTLRGCIGTFMPTCSDLADEIMNNAVSACSRDPRFKAVQRNELDDLVYSVDILSEPEPITSKDELDPQKYGVIVRSGSRRGLLLPDLDGVDTADSQIAIAKSKAGIGADTDVELERFEVVRYK